jgi:hypothetical protein
MEKKENGNFVGIKYASKIEAYFSSYSTGKAFRIAEEVAANFSEENSYLCDNDKTSYKDVCLALIKIYLVMHKKKASIRHLTEDQKLEVFYEMKKKFMKERERNLKENKTKAVEK